MNATTLSKEYRAILAHATRIFFSNPFASVKQDTDRELAPDQLTAALRACMEAHDSFTSYTEADGHLLKYAFLQDLFARHADACAQLIELDLAAGSMPPPASFADAMLAEMRALGLVPAAACGYLALFYQRERARYFIERVTPDRSPLTDEVRRRLWDMVFTSDMRHYEKHAWNRMGQFPLLVTGAPGVGKRAVAEVMGRSSFIPFDPAKGIFVRRIRSMFTAVNLSEYAPSALDVLLFGNENERECRPGILGACPPHGVLLLDAIEVCPPPVQAKLANALRTQTYVPVGAHTPRRFSGRLIAASALPPEQLRHNHFRADLHHILCAGVVELPTLRDRLIDNPNEMNALVANVLTRLFGRTDQKMADTVVHCLAESPGVHYTWPGNLRELGQAVRAIVLTGRYEGVPADAKASEQHSPADALWHRLQNGTMRMTELQAFYCTLLYEQTGTYGEVARRTGLNWRTVKRYVEKGT